MHSFFRSPFLCLSFSSIFCYPGSSVFIFYSSESDDIDEAVTHFSLMMTVTTEVATRFLSPAIPARLRQLHEEWRGRHRALWIKAFVLPQVQRNSGGESQPAATATRDRGRGREVARRALLQLPQGVYPVPAESRLPLPQHHPGGPAERVRHSLHICPILIYLFYFTYCL